METLHDLLKTRDDAFGAQKRDGMIGKLTVLGTCDSVTDCERCGRAGLKRTVVLGSELEGEVYYGTTCASRATSRPAGYVTRKARAGRTFSHPDFTCGDCGGFSIEGDSLCSSCLALREVA